MKRSRYLEPLTLICSLSLIACGCVIKPALIPTRHFVLAPISELEHVPVGTQRPPIEVASVKMPSYLLRDSVVVRKGDNEFQYLETALWAERLDQSFRQTLAQNLTVLLASDQTYLTAAEPRSVVVRVFVDVQQFDVDAEGRGTLLAGWRLAAAGADKPIKTGQVHLTRSGPSPRGNPQAIASTLSALTADFSQELAQALRQPSRAGSDASPTGLTSSTDREPGKEN